MGQWVALHAQKRDTCLSLHCPRCRLAWWKSMYFDALWLSGLVHTQLPLHLGYHTTDVHWLPVCWRQLALQMWVLMIVSVVCSITTRWFSIGHQRKTPPWLECSNCNIALETLWVLPFPFFLCMVCFWMVAWPLFKARGGGVTDWLFLAKVVKWARMWFSMAWKKRIHMNYQMNIKMVPQQFHEFWYVFRYEMFRYGMGPDATRTPGCEQFRCPLLWLEIMQWTQRWHAHACLSLEWPHQVTNWSNNGLPVSCF